MVHVALRGLWGQSVKLLLHLEHVQGGDTKNLGLTTLEHGGAVGAWNYRNLCVNHADICQTTTIDADALFENAGTHDLL